ncbi:uncharacterized protein E5676_scaffold264G00260 [Cucumis melo var. makuwa]|uniref:Reverse transcriptase n=1 Tax=Cucumis melo var. makuwa TaxID=1194695 RepID=A0A5D3BP87_CUCMM|nr:uncharacterized protein E6C27_scaffold548G002630 [Cucumis melo var. makuwa]TYK01024.1 uncharacterized protein E5676_scaffold264G00260 [Cucumis melo var. makuwa]
MAKGIYKYEQGTITIKKSNEGDALNGQENDEPTTQAKSKALESEKCSSIKNEKKDVRLSKYRGFIKVKRHDVVFTRPQNNEPEDEVDVVGCGHVTIEEIFDHEIFEEDTEVATLSLEDKGQSTIDELKEVNLGTIKEHRPTFISAQLFDNDKNEYVSLIKAYKNVFAWSYKKMSGLDPKVAIHHLAIKLEHRPIKQAQRRFRIELISQIEEDINKLIEAGLICEVKYPTWIANIVLVRKKNGQLRVYVDFCDLNNACPKDDFPLPIMEIMIVAIAGHEALSFMDGPLGYN